MWCMDGCSCTIFPTSTDELSSRGHLLSLGHDGVAVDALWKRANVGRFLPPFSTNSAKISKFVLCVC